MVLLVATAMGDTPDELYARIRAAEPHADWVEVRLDGPSGLPWDLRSFFAGAKPAIATVRHEDDGGKSGADDATRNGILRRALLAGARAIDVEVWNAEAKAMVEEAHRAGARAIVSFHDLAGTPRADALLATLRGMRALGADWCKVATRVNGPQDAVALVEAARLARAEGIPYALMAVNDPFLRLVAAELGMALAYGSVPGAPAAASGQVPLDLMRKIAPPSARPGGPTAATRAAYLLGHPVSSSRSPAMQTAAFQAAGLDACYLALDVAPQNLDAALAGLRASPPLGANVTVPHKVAVLSLVDRVDASAAACGAANTLVFRDGQVEAHNTDGAGALDALAEAGVRVSGRQALVLGAGGAARGVAHALHQAGAKVVVANRTLARAQDVARALGVLWLPWDEAVGKLRAFDLVVNCTPVDGVVDAAALGPQAAVLDALVRPGGTKLVREAKARGHVAIPGEAMLLHQGARAFTLWTGKPAPVAAMRAALEEGPS